MTHTENENPTIVFIDDDHPVLSALRREMTGLGVNARCVTTREALFETLAREKVAMVVSDLHMPEIFGLDLLEEVKERYPGVLRGVLTGNAETNVMLRSVNTTSVSQFIPKPWDSAQLSLLASLARAHHNCQVLNEKKSLNGANPEKDRCLLDLEQRYPGITGVKRTANGAISVF